MSRLNHLRCILFLKMFFLLIFKAPDCLWKHLYLFELSKYLFDSSRKLCLSAFPGVHTSDRYLTHKLSELKYKPYNCNIQQHRCVI